MVKNGDGQSYLLKEFRFVNENLAKEEIDNDELPDIVVGFCTVLEKMFKIRLHKKNPALVFSPKKLSDSDSIVAVSLKKETDIHTASITDILYVYGKVFPRGIKDDEIETVKSILQVRNQFLHSYKKDADLDFDHTDVIKKMSTVWEKRIQPLAIIFFGKSKVRSAKPVRKYTEEELHMILVEEVRKKLQKNTYGQPVTISSTLTPTNSITTAFNSIQSNAYSLHSTTTEECPRCNTFNFAKRQIPSTGQYLYSCTFCNLELTEREFEIAKQVGL